MASYSVNERGVERARQLIDARQYVLDSEWGAVQPRAPEENAFLESHSWDEYAAWHLGLTEGAEDGTKARHAFVYGDFRRIHRTALIACVYRASEWRHKEVELAAHQAIGELDRFGVRLERDLAHGGSGHRLAAVRRDERCHLALAAALQNQDSQPQEARSGHIVRADHGLGRRCN